MDHIHLQDCVDGGIYEVAARNFRVGIFRAATHSFLGLREKFDDLYLDEERHVEVPCGTARPLQLLDNVKLPANELLRQLLCANETVLLLSLPSQITRVAYCFDELQAATTKFENLRLQLWLRLTQPGERNVP